MSTTLPPLISNQFNLLSGHYNTVFPNARFELILDGEDYNSRVKGYALELMLRKLLQGSHDEGGDLIRLSDFKTIIKLTVIRDNSRYDGYLDYLHVETIFSAFEGIKLSSLSLEVYKDYSQFILNSCGIEFSEGVFRFSS
ncbi:MAG: hypothetical protein M0R77_00110 [Gammaproteobacteria bacterium]|nr:hypothetical protein [Acholeplasmataceae bacterium]MCK9528957.1 hypothetical protein [Gammaproteobacteria bacterium]